MFMFDSQVRIWLDQGDRYKRKSWQKLIIFLVAYRKKKGPVNREWNKDFKAGEKKIMDPNSLQC